jgi:hypothetical protein
VTRSRARSAPQSDASFAIGCTSRNAVSGHSWADPIQAIDVEGRPGSWRRKKESRYASEALVTAGVKGLLSLYP